MKKKRQYKIVKSKTYNNCWYQIWVKRWYGWDLFMDEAYVRYEDAERILLEETGVIKGITEEIVKEFVL